MGTIFKPLQATDRKTTKTLLHESIPITGALTSGTYVSSDSDLNVKNYSHGMFQSVYDYPYLSSSANHIYDITWGYSPNSTLSGSGHTQNAKKINIYNQMAQVLAGHDATGSIREFDEDGDLTGGTKLKECYFMNFSRLLVKDEIKKGTFSMEVGIGTGSGAENQDYLFDGQVFTDRLLITDHSGTNGYKVNSPAGEYGILYATSSYPAEGAVKGLTSTRKGLETTSTTGHKVACGLIYYQAGIAVLSGSVFTTATSGGILKSSLYVHTGDPKTVNKESGEFGGRGVTTHRSTGSSIELIADGLRNRIYNLSFNNTTELNSTMYFCRINHNDFNYSSNPTYISASKMVVKNSSTDSPVSYVTTVGMYSAQNELLAVAKLSEPLKKTPENEITLRVRLDY